MSQTDLQGIMIAYWLNVGFFFPEGSVSWRFPIAFQMVFIFFMLFCIVSPISPSLEWRY
jgi:hypothetical protein